ncbi:hypothetical protein KR215_002051, partial [Drosophila sulfurigaster]
AKMSRNGVLTDEQSKLNARLEAHMVYICPECGKAFRTQVEWRQHLNTKHDYLNKTHVDFNFKQIDKNFHECQMCFKWVENAHKTIALLQYHYFMHLEHRQTYRCVHCRLAFTRRRALNDHLLGAHIKEIEKYEAKLKRTPQETKGPKTIAKGATLSSRPRDDLLEKALMDIDLQNDDQHEAAAGNKANANVNSISHSSDQALDRCLNAYEDFVRKEESQHQAPDDVLGAPGLKFLQHHTEEIETDKEVVIIEIDALGAEEMHKLQKKMKSEPEAETDTSPTRKRKRDSNQQTLDTSKDDMDQSMDGIANLITYLCPQCGKEIDNVSDWRRHVFKKHDFEHIIEHSFKIKDNHSVCLKCHEVQPTTKRLELQKHCFKHLPYRSYLKCRLCDRSKTSMPKMFNHIRYNHQDELQRKNKTQLLIKPEPKWGVKRKLENPVQNLTVNADDELVCKFCHKTFKTVWRFDRHATICKAQDAYMQVTTVDALLKHLKEGQIRLNAISRKTQLE